MLWVSWGQVSSWHILLKAVEGMGDVFTPGDVLEKYVDTGRASAILSAGQRDEQGGYSVLRSSEFIES